MSIGVGIFLIAVGAILAFGIRDDEAGPVDLTVVGVVVMLAGAAGIWLSYKITNDRRRVPTDAIDPAVEEQYRTVEAGHEHDQHHTRIEHRPEGRAPQTKATPSSPQSSTPRPSTRQPSTPGSSAQQPIPQQPITRQPAAPETGDRLDPAQAVDRPRPAAPTEEPPPAERTIDLDPTASGLPEQPRRRSS